MKENARKPSHIQVNVLDLKPAIDHAVESLGEALKKTKYSSLTVVGKQGFVRTAKGLFMLDEEGVVSRTPLSDTNKWSIDLYPCNLTPKGDVGGMQIVPLAVMNINPAMLPDLPVQETVPLEQFIRTFGRRLEENYSICLQHLTKMGI